MFLLIRAAALAVLLFAATGAAAQNGPEANAGPDQTIECVPGDGVPVTLNGSGSSPDSGLMFSWTNAAGTEVATEAIATLPEPLPPGIYEFTLTVDDGVGGTDTDTVEITLNADTAPEIVLEDGSTRLWPPNHKTHPYATADLVAEVIDDCSELQPEDVFLTRATSDEPDDGAGDGSTRHDVTFGEGCSVAFVRAERAGTGNGRVYELFMQVADDAGNTSEETRFRVRVAHDQAHGPDKGPIEAHYACAAACASAPSECAPATPAEVTLRDGGKKGPSLRWRAEGFAAGNVSDAADLVCLYVDEVLAGGSAAPDKVKVKDKAGAGSLKVATKGADLELPGLPLQGIELRLELHDGPDACVASSFDNPLVNEAGLYEAATE